MLGAMAASAPTGTDPISWLVNYGVAGIVVALLVTGRLRTKAEVDGLREELGKAQGAVQERDLAMTALVQQVTQHTLPQMGQIADVLDRIERTATSSQQSVTPDVEALVSAIMARIDQRPTGTGGASDGA